MRTWLRASTVTICGGCGGSIARDAPLLVIALPGVKRRRLRCEQCAGEAPPELPPLIERSRDTRGAAMTPMSAGLKALRRDGKLAAAGREPGSDDE